MDTKREEDFAEKTMISSELNEEGSDANLDNAKRPKANKETAGPLPRRKRSYRLIVEQIRAKTLEIRAKLAREHPELFQNGPDGFPVLFENLLGKTEDPVKKKISFPRLFDVPLKKSKK